MSKRRVLLVVTGLGLILAGIGAYWAFFVDHEINLPQEQLQQKIDAQMPKTVKGVTVSNAKLDLTENKIGLGVDASVTKFKTEYRVGAATEGTLRYDANGGNFYFKPNKFRLTKLEANGLNVGEKVSKVLDRWAPQKVKTKRDELVAAAETFTDDLVQSASEHVFDRMPVYTLPDNLKGNTIRVLLKDVTVHDGMITAHLSVWQLTKAVIGYVVIFVLCGILFVLLLLKPEFANLLFAFASW